MFLCLHYFLMCKVEYGDWGREKRGERLLGREGEEEKEGKRDLALNP